jgi:hypothetical protein
MKVFGLMSLFNKDFRAKLTEAHLKALCMGEEIVLEDRQGNVVRLILDDMGWDRMHSVIKEAMYETEDKMP